LVGGAGRAGGELNLTESGLIKKLAPIKKKLFDVREKRDKPFLNKIALTAWSGLMIAGYAEAGRTLDEPKVSRSRSESGRFRAEASVDEGRPAVRTYGAAPGKEPKAAVSAYLEDYACLTHGLLTLHEATKDKKWLDASRKLTDTMLAFHGDKKIGGYYFTATTPRSSSPAPKTSTTASSPAATASRRATWSAWRS